MTVLRIIVTVLVGLGLGVIGGKLGLRRLLYVSVALVAIFASLSAIRGAYDETVEYFRNFMRLTTASVRLWPPIVRCRGPHGRRGSLATSCGQLTTGGRGSSHGPSDLRSARRTPCIRARRAPSIRFAGSRHGRGWRTTSTLLCWTRRWRSLAYPQGLRSMVGMPFHELAACFPIRGV